MDILKIRTSFIKGIIGKIARSQIKKHLDLDIDPKIEELTISIEGDSVKVHLNLDAEIPASEINNLVKRFM